MIYEEYLDRRKSTFKKSFELICQSIKDNPNDIYKILELGTSRSFVSGRIETNKNKWNENDISTWDWGAGIFTKVFADNILKQTKKFTIQTVDPSNDALFVSKIINHNIDEIQYIKNYSTNFLMNMNESVNFIYMDHAESSEETCQLHLNDAKIIVNRDLVKPGGIILIDDVEYPNFLVSKGKLSLPYLLKNGFDMVIGDYQVLLVKNKK